MRKIIILFILVLLISCGKDETYFIPGPTIGVPVVQEFEGVYYLDNNSFIELTTSYDGDITLESSSQLLVSINPQNNTYASHPSLTGKYESHSGQIRFTRNYTYTSGHDIENDTSGSNITGSKQTSIVIEKTIKGIKITVYIYASSMNNNLNYIVATRVFESI